MAMKLDALIRRIGVSGSLFGGKKSQPSVAPALKDATRLPNGTFHFKAQLAKGTPFVVQASTDLENWSPVLNEISSGEVTSYADGHASRFNYRFYRLLAGQAQPSNVVGYVSITLPPGFSMIACPLDAPTNTVGKVFKDWPDGTTLNKFDTQLFRLVENAVKFSQWTNPSERLMPGEGAIFFNPTLDYRSICFTGEVLTKNVSVAVASGFSIRSSPVPQPGALVEDLEFPIANGDVIHLFDREGQQYVLHPYENGKWTAGAPMLNVGEAFWVAKTEPGHWTRNLSVSEGAPNLSSN
ncbi:MAG: hypothetical protein ABSD29_14325 [Verrucomicrobiota bacterium]|jgi:hypothetical protein